LKPKDNVGNFINWSEYIREIWTCKDYTIIASLITCYFGGFYTKNCRLGGMWFWGKGDNWNTILAGQVKDDSLSNPLIKLLTEYGNKKLSNPIKKPQEILESIISEFLDSSTDKNWQYYFCKYRKQFLSDTNYYSWNNDEFEHELLNSTSSNPLLGYHINPYIKAVSNLLDNSICQESYCYARYSDESCLRLNNGFHLYSKQDGWHIIIPDEQTISDELRQKYIISEKNVFAEIDEKDRIEIAVGFCKELVLQTK
jgi:hypothetical protein